jgi:hypothetical protein
MCAVGVAGADEDAEGSAGTERPAGWRRRRPDARTASRPLTVAGPLTAARTARALLAAVFLAPVHAGGHDAAAAGPSRALPTAAATLTATAAAAPGGLDDTVPTTVVIDTAARLARALDPAMALGAGVDGHAPGDVARIYTTANLAAMESAGLGALTYRLRTELGIEAWHWNPSGRWSDGDHGYWTSDDSASAPILLSYGYRLPRRGNTFDQANNDGYSRLDDGDDTTYWKSNPYLDPRFVGHDGSPHAQWVLTDFGRRLAVDAVRILWGSPFAVDYVVQYWDGSEDPAQPDELPDGDWRTFPGGHVTMAHGGDTTLTLADHPVQARWLRLLLLRSSHTAVPGARDVRDSLGYAIREIFAGSHGPNDAFHDHVRHAPDDSSQTVFYVSSTDPWHRASDRDPDTEQPGLDRVLNSGLTRGLPLLVPVPLLYGTPADAAAEVRFLLGRGVRLRGIELGEEPDGQYVRPEDEGALFVQWARVLRRIEPDLPLGGPSLEMPYGGEMSAWHERGGDQTWTARFLTYLRRQSQPVEPEFFSFEWYPFDDLCVPTAPQLAEMPSLLADWMRRLRTALPRGTPIYMTEYGYSAFPGQAEVDLPGALMDADIVGRFLSLGGTAAYLYGYEPSRPDRHPRCDTWGNNMILEADSTGDVVVRTATYYAARLLTSEWAQPSDLAGARPGDSGAGPRDSGARLHHLYPADSDAHDARGFDLLSAYPLHRPDGRWAVLLINKDPDHAHAIRLRLRTRTGLAVFFRGPVDMLTFSAAQYAWGARGADGMPTRSEPPSRSSLGADAPVVLPPYSIVVVSGPGPG